MKDRTSEGRKSNGIGPQRKEDSAFQRRMRRHQSWFRHEVLNEPYGTGHTESSSTPRGNMLTEAAAEEGLNFLTPEIFGLAKNRLAEGKGGVEPFRLLRNMLSSQPMCFNLLGEAALDLNLATTLVRALWGDHVKKVTDVRFEWAPVPRKDYLNDGTSFDAMIEYESDTGLGFIGIETKLSETIESEESKRENYRDWLGKKPPWKIDTLEQAPQSEFNQFWRDHLLAWALLKHPSSNVDHGCMTVIYHPEDNKCHEAVAEYRNLLAEVDTFKPFNLAECVRVWRPHAPEWAAKFEARYLALSKSEVAE